MVAILSKIERSYVVMSILQGNKHETRIVDYKDIHISDLRIGMEFDIVIDCNGDYNYWLK